MTDKADLRAEVGVCSRAVHAVRFREAADAIDLADDMARGHIAYIDTLETRLAAAERVVEAAKDLIAVIDYGNVVLREHVVFGHAVEALDGYAKAYSTAKGEGK